MSQPIAKYKTPFFVLLVCCILLIAALIIVVLLFSQSSVPSKKYIGYPSLDGAIIETTSGNGYYQSFLFRTADGTDYYITVSPLTEIYDPIGDPVLVSALTPGLRIKVTHGGMIASAKPHYPDGRPTPTRLGLCYRIQILS